MAKFNQPDPRNEGTHCWVNGLVPRDAASVHVLDSVVQGGDAVWEGLRITDGHAIHVPGHRERFGRMVRIPNGPLQPLCVLLAHCIPILVAEDVCGGNRVELGHTGVGTAGSQ